MEAPTKIKISGQCSIFGGQHDTGMAWDEGLALYWTHDQADARPDIFLPRTALNGKWGTSKRLNTSAFYIAIRFPKGERSIEDWRKARFMIRNTRNGREIVCWLVDWGPRADCGAVDCSQGVVDAIGAVHDDICEVEEIC